jgi:hypothetical protein
VGYDIGDVAPLALLGYMDSAIENGPRVSPASVTMTSGRMLLSYVTAYRTLSTTQLGTSTRATPVGTLTNFRQGIYTVAANGDLTLVARTAQQTSGTYAAANTEYVYALDTAGGYPPSYTFIKGQRYALGALINFASTAPSLLGSHGFQAATLLAREPRICGNMSGQADLPVSVAAASVIADPNILHQYALA